VIERGNVVGQGVDPDVDHLALVSGYRHAPAAGALLRARNRDVLQTGFDEAQDLVLTRLRDDFQLVGRDPAVQLVAVLREAEEVVLLFDLYRRRTVHRALAVDQLLWLVEGL